jgi:Rod binding domain-containing protein
VIPLASIGLASSASAAMLPGPSATIHVGSATNSASSKASDLSKLTKAAGEFESILLESLWKSMKETFSDPDEDADPTLKSFDDWGIQAMANAVGNSGGLGIKNMILKYLEPTVSTGGGGSVSAR